ncbi:MAG: AAA family ATPase [Dehalococcoidia bacterium]|jgi:DNA repair exonuclease SbcCD ATPase subunit
MIYKRLKIANYKGISEKEIEFAENGITIVRGPNEVGKTSLGEAIWLLFGYPDSSKSRDITAIKPVNRDEGPEIELEAISGPYQFTYFKRYLKRPETRLTIVKPRPENLTSRSAHERAEAILKETLDISLWKALSIRQGAEIMQPNLEGQIWLSKALDQATGGHTTDQVAESLFEAVHQEYSNYFTESGTEKKNMVEHRQELLNCQTEVHTIEEAIRNLDNDVDFAARLKRELDQLKRSEQNIIDDIEKRSAILVDVSKLESRLSGEKLQLQEAKGNEKEARNIKDKRTNLIDDVTQAKDTVDEMQSSYESRVESFDQAKQELDKSRSAFDTAEGKKKNIQELVDLRQHDYEYFRHQLDFKLLSERKRRVDQARENAAKAKAILANNKIDENALASIEEARYGVISAKAELGAKSPTVIMQGLNECRLIKDGTEIDLKKGEQQSITIINDLKLVVPDMLEIHVNAGSSIDTLSRKVEEAITNLSNVCSSFGIDDANKTRDAFETRQQALRQITDLINIENDNLRDLTYEKLSELILDLQQSISTYLPMRVSEPKILENSELTKAELESLGKLKNTVEMEWENAKSRLDEAKRLKDERDGQYIEAKTKLDISKDNLDKLRKKLEEERAIIFDAMIDETLTNAVSSMERAKASVDAIEVSLIKLNPERERVLDETAKKSLDRIREQMKNTNTELVKTNTRLKLNGEDGLYDKLNVAKTKLVHADYDSSSLFRRAAAAKLLYETMRRERDIARHTYVAPLREKIEALGRLVYDDSLQIEVNDNLQIANRTLNGVTVEFNSLSGGTKEQLSLIFRLACGMMVAQDGGAPIMLDDTLGYTDPDRLRLMGAIIAKAAKECQIAIFTCVPDRYSNIGDAKEIVFN